MLVDNEQFLKDLKQIIQDKGFVNITFKAYTFKNSKSGCSDDDTKEGLANKYPLLFRVKSGTTKRSTVVPIDSLDAFEPSYTAALRAFVDSKKKAKKTTS